MIGPFRNKPIDVHMREFHTRIDMRAVYPMVAIQQGENGYWELLCEKQVLLETLLNMFWKRKALLMLVLCACIVFYVQRLRRK